jgi:hypothetical protein
MCVCVHVCVLEREKERELLLRLEQRMDRELESVVEKKSACVYKRESVCV